MTEVCNVLPNSNSIRMCFNVVSLFIFFKSLFQKPEKTVRFRVFIRVMERECSKGDKNLFEIRRVSSYRDSSYGKFLIRVS